jgi:hypothetical protein
VVTLRTCTGALFYLTNVDSHLPSERSTSKTSTCNVQRVYWTWRTSALSSNTTDNNMTLSQTHRIKPRGQNGTTTSLELLVFARNSSSKQHRPIVRQNNIPVFEGPSSNLGPSTEHLEIVSGFPQSFQPNFETSPPLCPDKWVKTLSNRSLAANHPPSTRCRRDAPPHVAPPTESLSEQRETFRSDRKQGKLNKSIRKVSLCEIWDSHNGFAEVPGLLGY